MMAVIVSLLESWPGMILTSVLVVMALCLAALPFLILNRLNQILEILQAIASDQQGETMATINRNVGWLVLNLPKLLQGSND